MNSETKIRAPRASGITLIELLVVMALLSLAAGLAGPAIGAGLENMTLRSAGRQLVSLFRQTQAEARGRQETIAAHVEGGRVVLVTTGGSVRTVEMNAAVRVLGEGAPPAYLFLGSGQILGPERLELENRRGRRGALQLGPVPGRITFVEGESGEP